MRRSGRLEGLTVDNKCYGQCECGGALYPIFFTEEETVVQHGVMCRTGRKRRAVSCLVCEECLRSYTVDDTFDGPWYRS